MLRAIIFDFDGIIADSEPLHFKVLQRVLGEIGIFLSKEEYYSTYLGFDDKGCFQTALAAHGRPISPASIEDLVGRKATVFLDLLKQQLVVYPGVCELVREAAGRCRLAIASGALRHEIEFVLEHAGIKKEFDHITSAEDVVHGKPDPEAFLHALTMLNQGRPAEAPPLEPDECLVIEDSTPGVHAARAAGMKVLAVTNTHPRQDLAEADFVTQSLTDITLTGLERRLYRAT